MIYCRDCVAPLKSYNVKPENKTPWYTKELAGAARIRDKSYKEAINAKKSESSLECSPEWKKFRFLRDAFKSILRKAKSNYSNRF